MNRTTLRLALVAGLVAPLALASASLAQPAPPPPQGGDQGLPREHMRDPAERRAHMAEHLRNVLQLEPGQQGALDAYLAAIAPPPGEHRDHGMQGDDDMQALPAPDRLDHMLARLDKMRAHLAAVDEATKTFYAQLTPPQQKAFDAIVPMILHRGGGSGHGRGGPGGWGHHGDQGQGPGGAPPMAPGAQP